MAGIVGAGGREQLKTTLYTEGKWGKVDMPVTLRPQWD